MEGEGCNGRGGIKWKGRDIMEGEGYNGKILYLARTHFNVSYENLLTYRKAIWSNQFTLAPYTSLSLHHALDQNWGFLCSFRYLKNCDNWIQTRNFIVCAHGPGNGRVFCVLIKLCMSFKELPSWSICKTTRSWTTRAGGPSKSDWTHFFTQICGLHLIVQGSLHASNYAYTQMHVSCG